MTDTATTTTIDWNDLPDETEFHHQGFRDVGLCVRECLRRRALNNRLIHLSVDEPNGSWWACSITPEWSLRKVPEDQREQRLKEVMEVLERS